MQKTIAFLLLLSALYIQSSQAQSGYQMQPIPIASRWAKYVNDMRGNHKGTGPVPGEFLRHDQRSIISIFYIGPFEKLIKKHE